MPGRTHLTGGGESKVSNYEGVSTGQLIDDYIVARDKLRNGAAKYKEWSQPIEDKQLARENEVLRRLNEQHQQSAKAESGAIAFKQVATHVRVTDRDQFFNFLTAEWEEASPMLTNAVSKEAVKEYMSMHDDNAPPGIEVTNIIGVNFRKG